MPPRPDTFTAKAYPEPPFDFHGVTARVFPLKANLQSLQRLCDEYFNTRQGNDPVAEFRPVAPYVFLVVIRYEKMLPKEPPQENLFGAKGYTPWVSQNELAFFFPIEWRRKENGRMVFHNWANFSPYVFVDSDLSLISGREVYGWQKHPAWFTAGPDSDPWLASPVQRTTRLVTIRTTDAPLVHPAMKSRKREFKVGGKEELKKFLTIDRKDPTSFAQYRPPYNPVDLLLSGPRLALDGLGALFEGIGLLGSLPIVGAQTAADRALHAGAIAKGFRGLAQLFGDGPREQIFHTLFPGISYGEVKNLLLQQLGMSSQEGSGAGLALEQITLKRFDETSDPEKAAYEAIVSSRIMVTRYKNGGPLGDVALLPVDPTGGFQVCLYYGDSSSGSGKSIGAKIIADLGLDPADAPQTDEKSAAEQFAVARFSPLYPFWFEGDLSYAEGRNVWKKVREQ